MNGRAELAWEDRIELDVWYVDHRTPGLDLRILLRTPLALFGGTYQGRPAAGARLGVPLRVGPRGLDPTATLPAVTAVLFTCAGQRVDIISAFGALGDDDRGRQQRACARALPRRPHGAGAPRRGRRGVRAGAAAALVRKYDVRLVVPLTDLDQGLLARSREALAPPLVLVPEPEVCDAMGTSTWRTSSSSEHGIASPRSWLPEDVPDDARYPVLVKVREGFGSRHIYRPPILTSSTSSSATRRSTRSCRRPA